MKDRTMPKALKHGIREVAEATKSLYLWAKILGILVVSASLITNNVKRF